MVYQLVFADSRPPRNVLCFGPTQPSLLPPPVLRLGRAILAIRARRAEPSSVSGPRPGGWGLSPLVSPPTVSCPGFARGGEVLPGIQVDDCLITQVTSGAVRVGGDYQRTRVRELRSSVTQPATLSTMRRSHSFLYIPTWRTLSRSSPAFCSCCEQRLLKACAFD